MYALITHHDPGYQRLADLTWHENKTTYAKKHGYHMHARTDNFVTQQPNGLMTGFEKIHFAKHVLAEHPEYKWIWWTGTDTMITNFSTRIEERVYDSYHFIICVDINGINADSFLVRNTPEGRGFLDDILEQEQSGLKFWDSEQRVIANLLGFPGTSDPGWPYGEELAVNDRYKNIAKVMPQRYMNSFNYALYPQYKETRDKLDFDGNWELGDWLIHWPATPLDYRIQLATHYNDYIIK